MANGTIGMDADSTRPAAGRAEGLPAVRFAVLLAAVLSVSMSYGVTLSVLPFLLERLLGPNSAGDVARHTGWLTGLYTFALFFMSPVWGALSDRIDRRAVILVGLLGSSATLFMLDNAMGLVNVYVARIASGMFSAAVFPAALAYVAEASLAVHRPKNFAITASATTLGFLLGPVLGSWLSPMIITPPADMRVARILMLDSPFFLTALANLVAALAVAVLPALASGGVGSPAGTGRSAEGEATIRRALLLTAFVVFGVSAAEVGITLFGKHALSLGPRGISVFFVVCSLVMIVVQIWGYPLLTRKLGDRLTLIAAFSVMAIGLTIVPYAGSSSVVGLAFALASGGTGILIPALATRISDAAAASQGQALGRQAAAANLGQAVAAASTGVLFAAAPPAPFLVAAAVLAAGALVAARA